MEVGSKNIWGVLVVSCWWSGFVGQGLVALVVCLVFRFWGLCGSLVVWVWWSRVEMGCWWSRFGDHGFVLFWLSGFGGQGRLV